MKKIFFVLVIASCFLSISCVKKDLKNEKETSARVLQPAQESIILEDSLVGKDLYVRENLRIRERESKDSNIITTMTFGTKVNVLEVGVADRIGGISGNWVKIRTVNTTYDRKGNLLKSGTTGWCFSGYLSETISHDDLIGNWVSDYMYLYINLDLTFAFGRKESSGLYGRLYPEENLLYATGLGWEEEVFPDETWQIVYLEKDALAINMNGNLYEFVRTKKR